VRRSFEAAFVVAWVWANREALNALGEERVLLYEVPESLLKLPQMEEFQRQRPFRPRKYPEREKVLKRLEGAARAVELDPEFEELLGLARGS
ncbi:MAG: hypothetical protein GXO07_03315, partial [Crenarchaeota archaeon]|nr:hypothetical protein [Thermoproteota archaeon]